MTHQSSLEGQSSFECQSIHLYNPTYPNICTLSFILSHLPLPHPPFLLTHLMMSKYYPTAHYYITLCNTVLAPQLTTYRLPLLGTCKTHLGSLGLSTVDVDIDVVSFKGGKTTASPLINKTVTFFINHYSNSST